MVSFRTLTLHLANGKPCVLTN